jgi:LasA protease
LNSGKESQPSLHPQLLRRGLAICLSCISLLSGVTACTRTSAEQPSWHLIEPWVGEAPVTQTVEVLQPTSTPDTASMLMPPTRDPSQPYLTPTPDATRPPPELRTDGVYHIVQPGESLGGIAQQFGVSYQQITSANQIANPDVLYVGQQLLIPPPVLQPPGPSFKIVPDSELVYGPASVFFDLGSFVAERNGYLNGYSEEVEGDVFGGAQVVQLVAQRYSVNPRLLLAILEHQSGWVTRDAIDPVQQVYPIGFLSPGWEGLFAQLSWAADQLNRGFYLWRAGWSGPYIFIDGAMALPGSGLNAGTVAVQHLYSQLLPLPSWRDAVGEAGLYQTYLSFFGIPFDRAVEPITSDDLAQQEMTLPFEQGKTWSFTGGPHSAWGEGAAWAALDFAPPGNALGCVLSNEWIVAVADGLVVRSDRGEVLVDMDGDGYEQTGWVVLYMHVETRDRTPLGAVLKAGDRIGHPSCEGGVTTGTHLHIARKYNGVWIEADGEVPFVLDGWVSKGLGMPYDGVLSKGDQVVEACSCRADFNQVTR